MPTVFISYSHQDEAWKDKLLPHLHALERAGVELKVWHDRKIDGGDKWYPEIQEAMDSAAAAVLLISSDFLASRFCVQEEVPYLLKRQEDHGMLLVPVLLRPCPWKAHRWLADRQMLPRDGKCVAIDFAGDHADAVFAAVAEQVLAHFNQLASDPAPTLAIPAAVTKLAAEQPPVSDPAIVAPAPVPEWPEPSADHIDLTRLPETGKALFGRDEELSLLDSAWDSSTSSSPVRILAFTAHGGVGKSTLINRWLDEMKRAQFRGATRVFGWSFYSQGARDQAASGESFIAAALQFFGGEEGSQLAQSPVSAWDKGERLARFIGQKRALLVLDGLEPLQSGHAFDRGKLRDPGLESLLRTLARHASGLCVVSTREPLADLVGRTGVVSRDLEQITSQAGRALLRTARVVGTDAELEDLTRRFGPHALAVSLLGVYLHEQPGRGIGPAQELERLPGREPIDRVLAGFERWLSDRPELEVLRLLGLFDRPADSGCLGVLGAKPAIGGLTRHVVGLTSSEWEQVLGRLEELRLVYVQRRDRGQWSVDCHPLIREHFSGWLQKKKLIAWRTAHRRLYEHLCATTQEGDQPTLEDLQPLYQAVAHGCQAGITEEARAKVYRDRIQRGQEVYSGNKLGSFGSDLGAIACLFKQPWGELLPGVSESGQGWLFNEAAFCLRALGRLAEALGPMRSGVELAVKRSYWEDAAAGSSNLSELELTLGEVAGAVRDAEQSVTYADRSGDVFQRMSKRTTYADALHQTGRRAEAETRFCEAEQMQAASQPGYPLLYSARGFKYCDLLLAAPERAAWQVCLGGAGHRPAPVGDPPTGTGANVPSPSSRPSKTSAAPVASGGSPDATGRWPVPPELLDSCRAVSQRAAQTLKIGEANSWLLDIALNHLTLGRAALYESILGGRGSTRAQTSSAEEKVRAGVEAGPPKDVLQTARRELDAAVSGLRRAGTTHWIPAALLTRAWLRFLTGARSGSGSAQADSWTKPVKSPSAAP